MPLPASLSSFLNRRDPATVKVMATMALLAAGLGIFLVRADKPWNPKIVARWASERGPRLDDFIDVGMWWGGAVALAVLAVMLLAQRWWSLPGAPVFPDGGKPVIAPSQRRWVWIMLAAATLLAAVCRLQRLSHSFWNDEAMHLRLYVWGDPSGNQPDDPKFDAVTWKESVFQNKKGNNHIGSSLEGRVAHLLTGGTWDGTKPFVERNLRLFPWISGLLTVALTGFIGAALGNPRTGLAVGLIMAVHPWHQRWSVEMRGYSTMLLGVVAGLWCLIRALQTNRWRWWLGFALAQAVVLLWFAGSLYVVVAWNAVTLLMVMSSGATAADRISGALRLVVAGSFSLVPVALLMGPSVPQILAYLREKHEYAPMDMAWYGDLWAHLLTGLRSVGDAPGTSNGIGIHELAAWPRTPADRRITDGLLIYWILPILTVVGLVFFFRENWRSRLITLSILGAAIFACAHNMLTHAAMMNWYLLYLIPLFAFSLAWSVRAITQFFPKHWLLPYAPLLLAALYSHATGEALYLQQKVPRQPIREAVALVRGTSPDLKPDPSVVTAAFGTSAGQIRVYDPAVHLVENVDELRALTAKCRNDGKPLWIYLFNYPRSKHAASGDGVRRAWPAMLDYTEDSGEFERVGTVPGMETIWTCALYRSVPDTVIRLSPPQNKN
jgi:hypothetical protein